MGKRKTVSEDAIGALFDEKEPPPKKTPAKKAQKLKSSSAKKERFTVHLPGELIDRLRNAVYWTPGLTLASLAEEALIQAIDEIEKRNGEPFPPRTADLKGGRPLKQE